MREEEFKPLRAHGVMQAALEAALRYARERAVFQKPIYE
ncbi:acyl-CoA dehydrogenase, C-terminal domain protein, partial [Leptospira interrogans serovar Pyrogenes str. 2006006960]